jgi:integrase/recombinase XerD
MDETEPKSGRQLTAPKPGRTVAAASAGTVVPAIVADAGEHAKRRFLKFFAANNLDAYLDAYIEAAGIRDGGKGPLFRCAAGRTGALTDKPMNRIDPWRMVQRRATGHGTRVKIGCHTFRATGITSYLEAGGTLENAQAMAAHESPRTTKLYDRTGDEITFDEIERVAI